MDGSLQAPLVQDERRWRFPLWTKGVLGVVLFVLVSGCERNDRRGGIHSGKGAALYRCTKAKAGICAIEQAVNEYAIDHGGVYPSDLAPLVRDDESGYSYLAIESAPRDPWGHLYGYEPAPPGSTRFRVFSLGADGEPGGEGDDRDLDNLLIREGRL